MLFFWPTKPTSLGWLDLRLRNVTARSPGLIATPTQTVASRLDNTIFSTCDPECDAEAKFQGLPFVYKGPITTLDSLPNLNDLVWLQSFLKDLESLEAVQSSADVEVKRGRIPAC